MELIFSVFQSPGPEALNFGPLVFRWYGVLIAISVLVGLKISSKLANQRGISTLFINDLLPILILSSVIGAREICKKSIKSFAVSGG